MTHHRTILAVELDPSACKAYAANMPGTVVECRKVGDAVLPYADIVIGGPPCQDFSLAGKGKGKGGERDGWPEFIDAIRRVGPRMFLAENVPGMASERHSAYLKSIIGDLGALGYWVLMTQLDAANYGTPQFRRRIFLWGIRKNVAAVAKWPAPTTAWPAVGRRRGSLAQSMSLFDPLPLTPTVRDALGLDGDIQPPRQTGARERVPTTEPSVALTGTRCDELRIHEWRWSDAMLAKHPPAVGDGSSPTVQAKWFKGGAEGLVELDNPAPTLKAGGNTDRFGHLGGGSPPVATLRRPRGKGMIERWGEREDAKVTEPSPTIAAGSKASGPRLDVCENGIFVRRLTPRECLTLQGAPGDYIVPEGVTKTATYRIAGNGWACPVAAALARAFTLADPTSETVIDLFAGGGLGAVGFHQRFWTAEQRSAEGRAAS